MAVSKNTRQPKQAKGTGLSPFLMRRLREGGFILLIALGLFIFLAFITYHSSDPSWSNTGTGAKLQNMMGVIGAWLSDIFLYLFGYVAYLLPLASAYAGWLLLQEPPAEPKISPKLMVWLRVIGLVLMITSGCALFSLHLSTDRSYLPYTSGGILGSWVGPGLTALLNTLGTTLLLIAVFLSSITLFTGLSWIKVGQWLWQMLKKGMQSLIAQWSKSLAERKEEPLEIQDPIMAIKPKFTPVEPELKSVMPLNIVKKSAPAIAAKPAEKAEPKREQKTSFEGKNVGLPPLSLLEPANPNPDQGYSEEVLENLSRVIERKLAEFGIEVKVVAVYPGPVITRFELDLAAGIKVSKLVTLSKDIARALSFVSVRIVEAIPGKSYVGLEIPNQKRETVRLREILDSTEYEAAKSPLSLGLGKDIGGHPVIVDLAKMPHLLVAGTTGSGKSVGLNAMLLSLLYKSTPEDVRLILVDPKMLELAMYDGIPHLLTPVITDMKHAANALRWAIGEMERRYRLMSQLGVRNLAGYNQKIRDAKEKGESIKDPLWDKDKAEPAPDLTTLPYIVVLIDEFADMMMVVGKKVDELIARLAQKARAAGIHLILATQRPSVDVITGLIKANIPTRIAFQVSSRIDSRTILDQQGAEQLLGHGDMLYMEPGMGIPIRIHGAFVADDEVHKVVDDLKQKAEPVYLEAITQGGDNPAAIPGLDLGDEGSNGNSGVDELFDQAVEIVAKTRRASISNVQRRLKIGYNRAATILEQMEEQGMVSAMEANGTRDVLLPPVEE
jgi:S-DNA-T family DNA segregation ATPase FtsK/SpoIIIE